MSLPSYQLFKNSLGVWICSGEMPTSGRPFRFEAGKGTRDVAKAVAENTLRRRVQSAEGSRKRWVKWKAERANGEQRTAPAKSSTPRDPPAPARKSADEIRAKLLGLGDAAPVDADAVLPPTDEGATGAAADGDQGGEEEPADDLDDEGAELIASLLAKGATFGLVGLVNRRLGKRKPPMRAEPHEKGLEWFHDGLEYHFKKLLGKTATLGPTGKIFAGNNAASCIPWMMRPICK